MSPTNKVFKKILNVNRVKICNVDYYTDHKGEDHLKISVDLHKSEKTDVLSVIRNVKDMTLPPIREYGGISILEES